jgi:enoyl-CoA hydratase/carnithine racemase
VSVVSDRATFRAPELFRGIADTHYSHILSRQIGPARARDMLFTGRQVSAREAADWGLVSRVVAHDELMDVATEAVSACCRTAPAARSDLKRSFDQYYGLYDRIGMTASLYAPEAVEGYNSFKEKRPPSWVDPRLGTEGRL